MQATDTQLCIIAVYIYCVKKYHVHFRISYTMNAEDIFRSSIGCEIMLMIKARIRLIFSRYNTVDGRFPSFRLYFLDFFKNKLFIHGYVIICSVILI